MANEAEYKVTCTGVLVGRIQCWATTPREAIRQALVNLQTIRVGENLTILVERVS